MEDQKKTLFKTGSYIYIEGDEDVDGVYIIESGAVELSVSGKKISIPRKTADAGDIIGFISALSSKPRLHTAIAIKDSVLVFLSKEKFYNLLQKNHDIAFKIIHYFAEELRAYDELIFSIDDNYKSQSDDIEMFSLAEYYHNKGDNYFANYILHQLISQFPESSEINNAKKIITEIQDESIRKISEPIKEDIYNVYTDGQIIFCEGEPGTELYIIKEGKVQISKYKNGTDMILSMLKEGDIFGELAIVSDKPRNATAVSRSKTVLLPINLNSLSLLFEKSPGILKRIYTAISQRVWFSIIRLESKLYKKNVTKIYAFLENKLLEDNVSLKSDSSHSFNFGIDELLKMNDISQEEDKNSITLLLSDQNLNFNFGQIKIKNASEISAMSSYYKTRDNIADSQEKSDS